MTYYDPFQTYSAIGNYPGATTNPFQSPYNPIQMTAFHPPAAYGLAGIGHPGIGGGIHPLLIQQAQLAALAASRAGVPFATGFENPLLNPIVAQQFGQNPLLNPYGLTPHGGQVGGQFGHAGSPFGQVNPMLAPQTWVGQPGIYGAGQIHPLVAQQLGRGWQNAGLTPWTMF